MASLTSTLDWEATMAYIGRDALLETLENEPITRDRMKDILLGTWKPESDDVTLSPYNLHTSLDKKTGMLHIDMEGAYIYSRSDKKRRKRTPKEVQPMKHNTVLKFWLEVTRQVLTGIPNKVAGGYARDLHFGVEPKDVDFFVRYSEKTVNEVLDRLKQLKLPHHDCSDDLRDGETNYPTNEDDGDARIAQVIKVGDFVDIIFVNHTLGKVTANFDFNINQFELGMMDDPIYTGEPHNTVLQLVNDTNLNETFKDISRARITKMVKKADTYGWVCSQEVLDVIKDM